MGKLNGEHLENEFKLVAKYININTALNEKQKNRFYKLFTTGKEAYVFLILRILDVYTLYLKPNLSLFYNNKEYPKIIFNMIFSDNFFSKMKDYIIFPTPQVLSDIEDVEKENDEDELINDLLKNDQKILFQNEQTA